MFYSQFILAKKGPLGTIWIAAHLERKLRKNQVADTDIGVSVDSILFPEVPIALRLSSHLLLGVVRIYNRKVNYLFDDCSEALLKIKQAFRSTAVDLPPEESKAPYHSITLPETFDLDDFELPDNDIFQGNYVDHHISSREQITLQDSMEGVSYSTSKFGLDERFGDGDTSGLDLDQELFLDKIDTAGHADESAEPQASVQLMTTLGKDGHRADRRLTLDNMVGRVDEYTDLMDYAHAPCTPGLVEEPNFSNVQEASTCDDPLESEYHLTESTTRENSKNITNEDKQEVDWCSRDGDNSDAMPLVQPEENGYQSRSLEIKESKLQEESPSVAANVEHVSLNESSSELTDKIMKPSDVHCMEDLQNGMVNKDMPYSLSVDEPCDDHHDSQKNGSERSVSEISILTSPCQQVSEGVSVKDQSPLGIEVPGSVGIASDQEKSCLDASEFALENKDGSFSKNLGTPAYQEPTDAIALKLDVLEKVASSETPFLRPCNSNLERPDITNSGCSADIPVDVAALATSGRDTATIGEACCITGYSEQVLKEIHVVEASCKDIHAASSEHDGQVHNANLQERLEENLNKSEGSEVPAPEKLLAVPDGHADLHRNMLEEVNPRDFEGLDEGDAGSKVVTGKKRSFTESTLTEQSLNSVESSRLLRFKRTAESIPDDDDLLSSILVGRRSSVLKVKPTPPFSEVTSMKRARSASRSGPPKRKVLMDDTMVLHGDTIRQQLTNTEDIRRVRKKAPCTRPEISMIQNQFLEDEIFLEAILRGMPIELASLHHQMGDLSRIRVCQNDPNEALLKNVSETRLPFGNNENGVSLEIVVEQKLASNNDCCDVSLETAIEPHLTSQNAENGMTLEIENDKGFSGPNVAEQSGMAEKCEYSSIRDDEIAVPGEKSIRSDNKLEEVYSMSVDVNISEEQIDVETDVFHQDFLLGVAELETCEKNADAGNPAVIAEPESVSSIEHNDMNDTSAGTVQTSLNKTCEKNSPVNVNASNLLPDQIADAPFVELDSAIMNLDNGQAIGRGEIKEENGTVDARDDAVSNVSQDGGAVELLPNAKHGDLEYNIQSEIYGVTSGKQQVLDSSFSAQICVQNDGPMNNGENPAQPEGYQPSVMNGEYSGFDLHGQDDLNYLPPGNDTEFLNVDDDELTEIADDYMPDAEETPLTENSGWSSRTRAVSKYLQTIFVKEAECGRKSLSMDELLSGKSRKEASRMFFEALVLKTRDYIHVEQQNPFDSITIKPRVRLMKSDF